MKKLKRWNRGLLAAAVLIIGVVIFQLADQARFKSSIPEIISIIKNYETQACETLKSAGGTSGASEFLAALEKYWQDPKTVSQAMRYSTTRSSFYNILEDDSVFFPLAYEETLQSCRIRKNGPGTCSADLVIDSTVWTDRYGSYLAPFGVGYAYNEAAEDYTEELEVPASVKDGSQAVRLSCQLNVTLQLTEDDGSWKITYCQMYAMSTSSSLVDIQEVPV